ncbi:hypothetical protein [Mycolicibacterium litorale]|uniref:hypothetical protein n=1 Tax=Mycolicibacterium litorale TaxID=758802 RepID=UPI0039A22F17
MTDEAAETGVEPSSPRRFGQLPNLVVSGDFDEPLPPTETAVWEAGDPAALDDDWPIEEAGGQSSS